MNTLDQTWVLLRRLGARGILTPAYFILAACLFTSAFISASLEQFSRGLSQSLDDDIASFLGAPLVVRASQSIASERWKLIGKQPVSTVSITTGVITEKGYRSIALKGVSPNYPLQGELKLRGEDGSLVDAEGIPKAGQAWLDAYALSELGVSKGDSIQVGRALFKVSNEIALEPDRLTQLQHVLPRVMVTLSEVSESGVALSSGRAEFRYLFNIAAGEQGTFKKRLADHLDLDYQLLTSDAGQHPFSRISQRVSRFLSAVTVLVLILCGVATAALSGHAFRAYLLPATVLRCMGAEKHAASLALLLQITGIAIIASILASIAACLSQGWMASLLEPHLRLPRMGFNFRAMIYVCTTSALIVVVFVLPKLRVLNNLSVISILRSQGEEAPRSKLSLALAVLVFSFLLWLSSDNLQLTLFLGGGLALAIGFSIVCAWLTSKAFGQSYRLLSGPARVAVRSIARQPLHHLMSLVTVAIAIMAVMMTLTLRGSFIDAFHSQRLNFDGNYFFKNLPLSQGDNFERLVNAHGASLKARFPYLRAHLATINGLGIDQALTQESDTREEARSPVRLSWSAQLPTNNQIISGAWPADGSAEVSVEAEVMSDLNLQIGDILGFKIGNTVFEARISSTRKFKGGGSSFMFWFMFSPSTLEQFKADGQVMGGLDIPATATGLIRNVLNDHPHAQIVDLNEQIQRIRATMISLTTAANAVLGLVLAAAATLILASIAIGFERRAQQINLFRALGLNRGGCFVYVLIEYLAVGIFATCIGAASAYGMSRLMYQNLFAFPYIFDLRLNSLVLVSVLVFFATLGALLARLATQRPVWISMSS